MDQNLLIIGIVALAIGLGLGFLLGNLKSKGASTRAQDAEAELDAYRKQVTSHFSQTAEHFQALGMQYKSLYEHLAAGADDLCDTPDAGRELSFVPAGMLTAQAETVSTETEDPEVAPAAEALETSNEVLAEDEVEDVAAAVLAAEPPDDAESGSQAEGTGDESATQPGEPLRSRTEAAESIAVTPPGEQDSDGEDREAQDPSDGPSENKAGEENTEAPRVAAEGDKNDENHRIYH